MKLSNVLYGIDAFFSKEIKQIDGCGVGLVSHPASTDVRGCPSAVRLHRVKDCKLKALFSPEHGLFGIASAGEKVSSIIHPSWGIPVYSLYGETRRPAAKMFENLDAVIYDLQDLSIRCYTYVSTLRYILEEAARNKIRVIVTDRPDPLAHVIDGPMLDSKFESFVGNFPGPMVYGLTSGEAALWLKKKLKLKTDLEVIPIQQYRRGDDVSPERWVSPSPGIRNPHTALCYPVTVCYEALPIIDYGRSSLMPFELIGSPDIDENELAEKLSKEKLPGIAFHPVVYECRGVIQHGVRIAVLDKFRYQPVSASVAVLTVLQQMMGRRKLWNTKGSRASFFDKLYGTDSVRRGIQSGAPWRKIASGWPLKKWEKQIASTRLYP